MDKVDGSCSKGSSSSCVQIIYESGRMHRPLVWMFHVKQDEMMQEIRSCLIVKVRMATRFTRGHVCGAKIEKGI